MLKEAAEAGFLQKSGPLDELTYPRIQNLTIQQILDANSQSIQPAACHFKKPAKRRREEIFACRSSAGVEDLAVPKSQRRGADFCGSLPFLAHTVNRAIPAPRGTEHHADRRKTSL